MKPTLRVNFAAFWPGFHPEHFRRFFPSLFDKYDVQLSPDETARSEGQALR